MYLQVHINLNLEEEPIISVNSGGARGGLGGARAPPRLAIAPP